MATINTLDLSIEQSKAFEESIKNIIRILENCGHMPEIRICKQSSEEYTVFILDGNTACYRDYIKPSFG